MPLGIAGVGRTGIDTIADWLAASRLIHFASVFILFGTPLFWIYGGRRTLSRELPGVGEASATLMRLVAWVALLSGLAWLFCTLAAMTGGFADAAQPSNVRLFFIETGFGPIWTVRLILLWAAIAAARAPFRARPVVLLGIGAALLVDQAWLGHAAAGGSTPRGLAMIASYVVHVVAAATWLGGLPPLLFALAGQRRGEAAEAPVGAPVVLAVLSRYSVAAGVAAGAVLLSGLANSAFRAGDALPHLADTAYGAILFAKVGLVAIMLILAVVNRFVLMPRLRAGRSGGPASLARSVGVELAVGVLVLAAAAVLGITPPPR